MRDMRDGRCRAIRRLGLRERQLGCWRAAGSRDPRLDRLGTAPTRGWSGAPHRSGVGGPRSCACALDQGIGERDQRRAHVPAVLRRDGTALALAALNKRPRSAPRASTRPILPEQGQVRGHGRRTTRDRSTACRVSASAGSRIRKRFRVIPPSSVFPFERTRPWVAPEPTPRSLRSREDSTQTRALHLRPRGSFATSPSYSYGLAAERLRLKPLRYSGRFVLVRERRGHLAAAQIVTQSQSQGHLKSA